jgi:hypothetical protein
MIANRGFSRRIVLATVHIFELFIPKTAASGFSYPIASSKHTPYDFTLQSTVTFSPDFCGRSVSKALQALLFLPVYATYGMLN